MKKLCLSQYQLHFGKMKLKFLNFKNLSIQIHMLIRWAIVTLTTVGYGDMVPQTIASQIFGGRMK